MNSMNPDEPEFALFVSLDRMEEDVRCAESGEDSGKLASRAMYFESLPGNLVRD
jgi:hypothetical protein